MESEERVKKTVENAEKNNPYIFSNQNNDIAKRLAVLDEHINVKPAKDYKKIMIALTIVNAAMMLVTIYLTVSK